jgi:hypothetical protein
MISNVIAWLNINSGFVMALLTLSYVITTFLIVRLNSQTVDEMRNTREEQMKAKIVVGLETRRRSLVCLVLRNIGGSIALNLSVSIEEDFLKCIDASCAEKLRKLKSASLTIVPNQELIYSIGGVGDYDNLIKSRLRGTIVYSDISQKEIIFNFNIDIESYGGILLHESELDELNSLLNKKLDDIATAIKRRNDYPT